MNIYLKDLPARLEAGTPNIAGVIGLGAAIDYLEKVDAATTKQIADDLGWSQSITHEKLLELIKKGKVEIIKR